MNWTAVKWTNVLLALGFIALGLVLVFDARSSSHALEWPLALSLLVVGVIWLVGRIGWLLVWKDRD